MSWLERLRPGLGLVAPDGKMFIASWIANDISVEKQVSRSAGYNMDGELVSDNGRGSFSWPLDVYFDGPDHDTEAMKFLNAVATRYPPIVGYWTVTHPVYGEKTLQPLSATLKADPVESGNVTLVTTEWVEPAREGETVSADDAAETVTSAADELNEASILTMIQNAYTDTVSATSSIGEQVRAGLAKIRKIAAAPSARINAIMNTVNQLSNEAYMNVASLSGSVIALVESPGLIAGSMAGKVGQFARLGRQIMSDLPAAASLTERQVNKALTGELFLNAISAAMGQAAISELPETRTEALSALNQYAQFSAESRAALDDMAVRTRERRFDQQFFSRRDSAEAILTMNKAVARYLMSILYDLKIEKRQTLRTARTPFDIAAEQMELSGNNFDEIYYFILRANNLHGRDILLLPAGKTVVTYG